MLSPASRGAETLRDFIARRGATVWFLDDAALRRAFELMEQYADHPMDLADASLIVAAETLATTKILTIDRQDFLTYRVRRGHRLVKIDIVD